MHPDSSVVFALVVTKDGGAGTGFLVFAAIAALVISYAIKRFSNGGK